MSLCTISSSDTYEYGKNNVSPTKNNLKYNTKPINCDCKCESADEHYYDIWNAMDEHNIPITNKQPINNTPHA